MAFSKLIKRLAAGAIVAAIGLVVVIQGGSGIFGQAPPPLPPLPPAAERIADIDGNKIFDNLEARVGPQADNAPTRVIVLFNQTLDQVDFPGLQGSLGPFDVGSRFRSINGIATTLTKGQIVQAARLGFVKQIELDSINVPHLDTSKHWFGVNAATSTFDVDGNTDDLATYSKDDMVIAVLDTGVNASHVDLDGGKVIGWKDFIFSLGSPYDEGGDCSAHGSHVSSIAAGAGDGDSSLMGVAPGAALIVGKVLGIQQLDPPKPQTGCVGFTSQVNAGIQWVIDNKNTFGINVLNMSLGGSGCSDGTDSQSLLVDAVAAVGIVPVLSAGNDGPGPCTIASPAASADAITVGAMADPTPGAAGGFGCGDAPAGGFYKICFSSVGPTLDGRIKPDVANAGVFINAVDGTTASGYVEFSGTSMASPFTAGTVALMQHARLDATLPLLSPLQTKQILMDTAGDWGPTDGSADSGVNADVDYGAGRVDVFKAVKAAGQFAGTNIALPVHRFISSSLDAPGGTTDVENWTVAITDTTQSIGATLILPDWSGGQPDFDLQLRDPLGTLVFSSGTVGRQETVGIGPPLIAGNYQVRVFGWPGGQGSPASTAGDYFLDISGGTPPVSATIITDGSTPFGFTEAGVTIDTTSASLDDVQTIKVLGGSADLFIKTGAFTDGFNTWSFHGTTPGTNVAVWEFSINETSWTAFPSSNTLVALSTSTLDSNDTLDVYFRLTVPTDSSSTLQHSTSITITAVPATP